MATAIELFEKFLENNNKSEFTYHLHELEELLAERTEVETDIASNHQQIAELSEDAEQSEVDELNAEVIHLDATLDRMNAVLAFVGTATTGWLLTKVVSTVEWEYQIPVYFTDDGDKANLAFDFFNAHAVITQP